jgi:hypothetical protein
MSIIPTPNIPMDPGTIRALYRHHRRKGVNPKQAFLIAKGEAGAAGRVDALLPMGVDSHYPVEAAAYRPVALDPDGVRAAGFDPEHLTARVAAKEESFDTVETRLSNMDVQITRRDPFLEGQDRPESYSIAADLSGPQASPEYVWLTDDGHYDYFLKAWANRRGARQHAIDRTREVTEALVQYVGRRLDGTYVDAHLQVETLWRGAVVGRSSVGFADMEWGAEWSCGIYGTVCELAEEAFEEAQKWAETAVSDAEREAAAVIRATTMLPDCALRPERFNEDEDAAHLAGSAEASP